MWGGLVRAGAPRRAEAADGVRHPYIVRPRYDWAFFLAPPFAAMVVGLLLSKLSFDDVSLGTGGSTRSSFFLGALIHGHLVAVFFRSHGNPEIRRLFPARFFLVPLLLF